MRLPRGLSTATGYQSGAIFVLAGGDGAQVFLNRIYGVLMCGLRLTEAPEGMVAKNVTWSPLNVVQGPSEPKSLHGVLAAVVAFFTAHDPGACLIDVRSSFHLLHVAPVGGVVYT